MCENPDTAEASLAGSFAKPASFAEVEKIWSSAVFFYKKPARKPLSL
ncbi:MAG: hypothetical protein U9P10_05325 [Thermodesulfobacteriota bacterium]|nr:hypothetical protein [Thermodesulfobacteriota bacterium]